MTADNTTRGIVLMVGATIVFSIQDMLTKYLVQSYAVQQILVIRYLFFALFAVLLAARTKPLRTVLSSKRPWFQIARSALIATSLGAFAYAVRVLPLADAHAILASAPLIATALSVPMLGEEVGPRRWAAVGVGFIGVLVILRPGLTVFQPAAFIVLATAIMYAAYNVMTRMASRDDDGETSLVYMAVVGAAMYTVLGPFVWQTPETADIWPFAAVAIAGAVGHYLLIKALEAAPASLLQPFNFLMLVWATINGYLVFGDFPDAWTLAGSAIVVGSGLYVIYRERARV